MPHIINKRLFPASLKNGSTFACPNFGVFEKLDKIYAFFEK
jgi:hypothetical protein